MGMLAGKVAFITGGASGIGKGTALRFAREGAKVATADMQPEEGEKARAETEAVGDEAVGDEALFFVTDVSDPEAVKSAIDGAVEKFGRLDSVFANAGINGVRAPPEELKPEEWDKTLAINLKGDVPDGPLRRAASGKGWRRLDHHHQRRQRRPDVLQPRRVHLQFQQGRTGRLHEDGRRLFCRRPFRRLRPRDPKFYRHPCRQ